MSDKKKTPPKEAEKAAEKPVQKVAPKKVTSKAAPKTSPKKVVSLFMFVVLLMIAGGFYLHQKGYITKYYPLVKSKLAPNKSLEDDVEVPEKGPDDIVEEAENSAISEVENSTVDEATDAPNASNPSEPRALISSPEEHPKIALLEDRIKTLEAKVEELSNSPMPVGEGALQADHTPLKDFSNLQDLTYKIQQGLPFQKELDASKSLFSSEDFEALNAFAKMGVPTLSYLSQHFKKVARLLDQEEAFQSATTVFEKGKAFLGQLVHVEKTDGPTYPKDSKDSKDSKTATFKALLRQGDVAIVVTEIEALNNTDETVALWITHGKAYDTAQSILTKAKKAFLTS